MTEDKIYINDNPKLRAQLWESDGVTKLDLTGYSTVKLYILKPDGSTEIINDATIEDEANGIVYYVCIDDDLDVAGVYIGQYRISYLSGLDHKSNSFYFEVFANYK